MKKIVLTEHQAQKLMKKIINEGYREDDKNYITVNCDFDYHGVTHKGGEIADIGSIQFTVYYAMDMEWRSYGLKGIYVGSFSGPEDIDVEIDYYPPDNPDGDWIEDMIKLPLDWSNQVVTNTDETLGYFGMDNEMEIVLGNDEQGNIIVKSIEVNIRDF